MFNINANPLRVSSIVFFLAILSLLISRMFISSNYKIHESELFNEENKIVGVSLGELHETLNNKEADIKIIDIREESDFEKSNIEGSINIPLSKILDKKSKNLFRKNTSFIISESESKSYSTVFLLNQLGYNLRPINSDYNTIRERVLNKFDASYRYYSDEKQQYDYPLFIKQSETQAQIKEETKQAPVSRGGC